MERDILNKAKRNIYISNMDADKAREMYMERINIVSTNEIINVLQAVGRVTWEAVFAVRSSPDYNAAAMDGIAVIAEKTSGVNEVNPLVLKKGQDFNYVNTGNIISEPYNAVIMIEDVMELDDEHVRLIKPACPWQHIRPVGEDIVSGEMLVPSGHRVRPVDLGALIAGGIEQIKVYKKFKVGIMPTGSEIVDKIAELEKGRIIDSNSRVFEALITEYGDTPNRYAPIRDDYQLIKESIQKRVVENDIVIIIAGSSAGTKDYTVEVIRELGEVVVHGVALKPGKPVILGIIDGKPVIGIPGYPVSAYITFETFVKSLLLDRFKQEINEEEHITAVVTKRIVSSFKHKELIRVNIGYINGKFVATPLTRGAGVTMSLVKADGILSVPQSCEGIEVSEAVEVKLLKPINKIKRSLVVIGSHDLIIDFISDIIPVTSGHVGSMGGIMALKRRECHLAPIHLLDESTGEYNISYIKRFFKGERMALIRGVKREQGFFVPRGNPNDLMGFSDLKKENIHFINRQKGSGTRLLLDYNLRKLGIKPEDINGYDREMNTHMAVAIGVKTGSANTGLGVKSAANALEMDFIPVGFENYDFVLYEKDLEDDKVKAFLQALSSEQLRISVQRAGGYSTEETGKVILVGDSN